MGLSPPFSAPDINRKLESGNIPPLLEGERHHPLSLFAVVGTKYIDGYVPSTGYEDGETNEGWITRDETWEGQVQRMWEETEDTSVVQSGSRTKRK